MPSDLQISNLKALDGTAGISIADSSGNITLNNPITTGTFNATIGDSATGFTGIREFDSWRLVGDFTTGSNSETLLGTGKWERDDGAMDSQYLSGGVGSSGSGLSLDTTSGVFTFPNTGRYLITVMGFLQHTGALNYAGLIIVCSVNAGSGDTYTERAESYTRVAASSQHSSIACQCIFDVTATSTHKFKINSNANTSGLTWKGSSSVTKTGFTVIRLSET